MIQATIGYHSEVVRDDTGNITSVTSDIMDDNISIIFTRFVQKDNLPYKELLKHIRVPAFEAREIEDIKKLIIENSQPFITDEKYITVTIGSTGKTTQLPLN